MTHEGLSQTFLCFLTRDVRHNFAARLSVSLKASVFWGSAILQYRCFLFLIVIESISPMVGVFCACL